MDYTKNKKGENRVVLNINKEGNQILASKKDREIFFNVLTGDENPANDALLSAIKYHDNLSNLI